MGLGSGVHGLKRRDEGPWIGFAGGSDDVINPGSTLSVAALVVEIKNNEKGRTTINNNAPGNARITFEYQHGCENSRLQSGAFEICPEELLKALGYSREPGSHEVI
jgi:hypothetical protein